MGIWIEDYRLTDGSKAFSWRSPPGGLRDDASFGSMVGYLNAGGMQRSSLESREKITSYLKK
jgi:hypothetical protein